MALASTSLFRNWWDDIDRYHREIDENFRRLNLWDDSLWSIPSYRRRWPWNEFEYRMDREITTWARVERDAHKYEITMDVQLFAPEEITVRTDDRCITIEGKHHQRKDRYGYVSRQFTRRYLLPREYDIGRLQPSLSSDGILTITAPKLVLPAPGDRYVPIRRTYLPAIKAK